MTTTIVLAVVLGAPAAGCTVTVPGTAAAAAPDAGTGSPGPAGTRSELVADPVADECLLNASEFGALVGGPVQPPEQATVARGDGSAGSSCVATSGRDPVAMINVYRVRTGAPADYVRAGGGGRRVLAGAGQAAVLVDTAAGPTLQLASPTYLVTILVSGAVPGDDAWRAAAAAALARLPTT
jgi:hypothetical protein